MDSLNIPNASLSHPQLHHQSISWEI